MLFLLVATTIDRNGRQTTSIRFSHPLSSQINSKDKARFMVEVEEKVSASFRVRIFESKLFLFFYCGGHRFGVSSSDEAVWIHQLYI